MEKLAAVAKPGVADASTLRELASAWTSMSVAHDVHSKHEDHVIFPALEALFPGTVSRKLPLSHAHKLAHHFCFPMLSTMFFITSTCMHALCSYISRVVHPSVAVIRKGLVSNFSPGSRDH